MYVCVCVPVCVWCPYLSMCVCTPPPCPGPPCPGVGHHLELLFLPCQPLHNNVSGRGTKDAGGPHRSQVD